MSRAAGGCCLEAHTARPLQRQCLRVSPVLSSVKRLQRSRLAQLQGAMMMTLYLLILGASVTCGTSTARGGWHRQPAVSVQLRRIAQVSMCGQLDMLRHCRRRLSAYRAHADRNTADVAEGKLAGNN